MKKKERLPNDEPEEVKFVFRTTSQLHAKLKEYANKDGRSMNGYLNQIMRDHFLDDRTIINKLDKIEAMIQRKLDKK